MDWALSNTAAPSLLPADHTRQAYCPPPARDHSFEQYVFAGLQCGGWFIEPNPREQDLVHEYLFELDAVARKPFGAAGLRLLAVEAKSGRNWQPKDTLLLVGRGTYIGAEGGVFAYRAATGAGLEERITARLREIGFVPMRLPDQDDPSPGGVLASVSGAFGLTLSQEVQDCYLTWLYSHIVQERFRVSWKRLMRELPQSAAVHAAREWNRQVYESLPLVACPVERLQRQEDAFRGFGRNLALSVAADLGLADGARLTWPTVGEGRNRWIQAALYLQHVARLAIFATLVEIAVFTPEPEARALVSGADTRLPHRGWRTQLAKVLERPAARHWPLLWQAYLCCWGGFLVPERRDDELELLAADAGTTRDEAEAALAAFDAVFPIPGGGRWHARTRDGLDVLTLVPAALRGVGVWHRLASADLLELDPSGHAIVARTLHDRYGATERAATAMASWYDIGAATLLGTLP